MLTKTVIDQAGKLDWRWRQGDLSGTKNAIKTIRRLLTQIERDLPNNEATE